MNTWIKNGLTIAALGSVIVGTSWAVKHYQKPGQLDVLTAQAMDMSQMRPPTGAAPVALAMVRVGTLADTVTYTGSILAYNEQDISPRITGTLVSLPVYPGDFVQAGQLVARLDTSQVEPQAAQAEAEARQAQSGTQVAELTHSLRSSAALAQASASADAAKQGVSDAQAGMQASVSAVAEAQAGVRSAQASDDYWKTEIAREKQLVDAGAVSRQEYQNELSQAQAAGAALSQAEAKVDQARATVQSARAKVQMARRQVDAALAGVRLAQADSAVTQSQAHLAAASADAAQAAARTAAVQRDYSRMTAPFGGVVMARPVAPGTLVQPGTVILKIAQIDQVRVQANVAVEDMAGVHRGTAVAISVQGDGSTGKSIAAQLTSVFPSASSQTRTAIVEAVVPNPGRRLLPGAFVTMQIAKSTGTEKLLVPASALVTENGLSYVWAVNGVALANQVYECTVCHMHYSAADAKKNHYKDPMDGGQLVPVKAAQTAAGMTVHQVGVEVGATNGTLTEVSSDALAAGTQVVSHGQVGLTDGAQVAATAWGANGPRSLPTAASASQGQTLYKCEKCGMTYSAADAKKHNYVDPMDGGKLVPVSPAPGSSAGGEMGGMKM